MLLMCGHRKYPYSPHGRLEISRGRGLSTGKFKRESMKLNWKFQGGGVGGLK